MLLSRKFAKSFFSVLMTAILVISPFVALSTVKVGAQELPAPVTAYSSITVKVDGVNFKTLYNFTTDLQNDGLWFPNVEETILVQGPTSPNSKKGTQYLQRSYFNGIQLDTQVDVVRDVKNFYYQLKGVGPVATYDAYYTFLPAANGAGTFTLTTKFTAPGITEETLTYLLNQAMQNILNYYNATGTINMNFIYVVE